MTNQSKIRVDDGAAAVSGSAAACSRILALVAAAGCQLLAFAAVAQPVIEPEKNPILDPASVGVGFVLGVVGVVVGVVTITATGRKKKD